MKRKNYLITLALVVITLSLSACGNQADTSADQQVTNNTPVVEETVETTEDVQQPEVEVESTEEVQQPETEVESTEEVVVEETTTEEPQVEMVDFETWAKQEGNDEVCLVVWNEELGIQEIVPTLQETEVMYQIQDGDKYAIPYKEKIIDIKINKETGIFSNYEYLELSLTKGEINMVNITFENEEGEHETINYVFN